LQDLVLQKKLKKLHQLLEDSVSVVIYGSDESSVNGIVQVLRQSGYTNIKALEGGFPAYLALKEGLNADSLPGIKSEARRYDYKSYLQGAPVEAAPLKKHL